MIYIVRVHSLVMLKELSFSLVTEGKDESELASWEATMNEGLEATKIADSALNALSPIDDEMAQQCSNELKTCPSVPKDDELLL